MYIFVYICQLMIKPRPTVTTLILFSIYPHGKRNFLSGWSFLATFLKLLPHFLATSQKGMDFPSMRYRNPMVGTHMWHIAYAAHRAASRLPTHQKKKTTWITTSIRRRSDEGAAKTRTKRLKSIVTAILKPEDTEEMVSLARGILGDKEGLFCI